MAHPALFQERAVTIAAPTHRFSLLLVPDGDLLGMDDDGRTAVFPTADDRVMWEAVPGGYQHALSGATLDARPLTDGRCELLLDGAALDAQGRPSASAAPFAVGRGPARLPSDHLRFFREQGWVCLSRILASEIVEELQKVACTDGYAEREPDRTRPQLSQSAAVARTAAEPVSLWLIRQYMRTEDVRLAHTPAVIVLTKDDGRRNVQGWHSDYPYHWGIRAAGKVPTPSGETVLGVQRNVCVSDFTKVRGATAFKLGSHAHDHGPPESWGTAAAHAKPGHRAAHGLPYSGPEADVIEAPAGSIILYDARTWHRAGVNRTQSKRAAMLQAMTPMYVMPKNDTSGAYKHFLHSSVYGELNARERREMQRLMVHSFIGPGGRYAIGPDRELTERLRA